MSGINLSYEIEQKVALMKAMNIANDQIVENLDISYTQLTDLLKDESFLKIIDLYKEELQKEEVPDEFSKNSGLMHFWVQKKLIDLSNAAEKDIAFIKEYIQNNLPKVSPKEFGVFISGYTNLLNVQNNVLANIYKMNNERDRNEISRAKVGGNKGIKNFSAADITDIKKYIREIEKEELKELLDDND